MQNKNASDHDHAKDYPTIEDLIREQIVSDDESYTVHHRRDLDSIG